MIDLPFFPRTRSISSSSMSEGENVKKDSLSLPHYWDKQITRRPAPANVKYRTVFSNPFLFLKSPKFLHIKLNSTHPWLLNKKQSTLEQKGTGSLILFPVVRILPSPLRSNIYLVPMRFFLYQFCPHVPLPDVNYSLCSHQFRIANSLFLRTSLSSFPQQWPPHKIQDNFKHSETLPAGVIHKYHGGDPNQKMAPPIRHSGRRLYETVRSRSNLSHEFLNTRTSDPQADQPKEPQPFRR